MNLAGMLMRAAQRLGDHPALAQGPRTVMGFRDLARSVASVAGALQAMGLQPGDRVALAMKNCPDYVTLLYGIWHAGLAAVPINGKLHAREFQYILEHSGARLCFVTSDLEPVIAGLAGELPALERIVCAGTPDHRRMLQTDPAPMAAVGDDDLAWLFYTSGTTGRPKGAMLSHRNLRAMSLSYFVDIDAIAPGDSILHAAPLSHGSGLYMLPHMMMGATQVIPESGGFDPVEMADLIPHHRGLTLFAAPTMVKRFVNHPGIGGADLGNLKTIVYGGAPMYVADLKQALNVLGNKLAQLYGQGESPMTITGMTKAQYAMRDHPRWEQRIASAGQAQSVVEVRVVDAEDRPLPPGAVGEIICRGDSVMLGYWNNPEATAKTLAGGWLHTGDMGSFDEDGYLSLHDRSKDVIISGGSNIYPREVEEVLLTHPQVAEVSVVGAPHADWGEEVVAFVVAREGGPGDRVPEAELDALCLSNIARFKRPKRYRFIAALPKNNYGKILKTELRTLLEKEGV